MSNKQGLGNTPQSTLLPKTDAKTKRPSLYRVVLINDDFTPMDFVVFVIRNFFNKGHEDAVNVMLQVHHKGSGACGKFTRDVAETKVEQVISFARQHEHPLRCIMEKD